MSQHVQASQLRQDNRFMTEAGNVYRVVERKRSGHVRAFICCKHNEFGASEIRLKPHELVYLLDEEEVSAHQQQSLEGCHWITHLELPSTT